MHLLMICLALGLGITIRYYYGLLFSRLNPWQRSLIAFVIPPLLLLMTAIAVIAMGDHGEMLGLPAGHFSYLLAIFFLGFAFIKWLQLTYEGWHSTENLKRYPQQCITNNVIARIIDIDLPYSAQIGFWNPELVITKGLLETLDKEHLNAVIAHEKAHANYHDTFCFFWLGWLKQISFWLPKTNCIWQDLLLLREIRADQKAAQNVDPLMLAESLLRVAQEVNKIVTVKPLGIVEAAFHEISLNNRLEERINALFDEPNYSRFEQIDWYYMLIILLPLISIPFHQ